MSVKTETEIENEPNKFKDEDFAFNEKTFEAFTKAGVQPLDDFEHTDWQIRGSSNT